MGNEARRNHADTDAIYKAGTGALLYIYMEKWMLKIKFISRDRSAYSGIIQEWEG